MKRTKIMLVEDQLIIATAIKWDLQKSGYEVIGPATSCQQALSRFAESRPDVVLMDIRINKPVDGIQTAHEIHKDSEVPIIFMTAHADSNSRERASAAGAFDYLIKPVGHAVLLSAIEAAMAGKRQSGPSIDS